jgi:ATP sulfurylase
MRKKLLCTLGPSSLNERVIVRLTELGVSLFRLNLSHTKVRDAARIIRFVQDLTPVPLSLDTEGAQIRTGDLVTGRIQVRENAVIRIHRQRVPGDSRDFNLYPPDIVEQFLVGDFVHIDADVLTQVVETKPEWVAMRVLSGGEISQNKAVTVERDIAMPPLTRKDRQILEIGRSLGIRHVALSFANRAKDIDDLCAIAGEDVTVVSKIECLPGLANLREIAARSNAILIDRGDLSRQVPIEQIPAVQKGVIRVAHEANREVYVATNLMESMTVSPVPTRAEVNDVYNTLIDGADGLVLAAETAIGKYPIGCAGMIIKLINEFEGQEGREFTFHPSPPISLLVDPHGGRLVRRELAGSDRAELEKLPTLRASEETLLECEQMALGLYSPLSGFMGPAELEGVLHQNRLPDGPVWTLPIVLQAGSEDLSRVRPEERVALVDASGRIRSVVDVTRVFTVDLEELALRWFGTSSTSHPGVARLMAGGETLIAGDVTLVEPGPSPYRRYELSPTQTRSVFTKKGWNRVVGFCALGVPHRADEAMQLLALESSHADGLFINPAIRAARNGDFLPEAILKSYQMMLEFGIYPAGRAVLGCIADYPRFAGPREVVFKALCQKNVGCSHVVVGPNVPCAGELYEKDAIRKLFEEVGDLGVVPLFFEDLGYDPAADEYRPLAESGTLPLDTNEMRRALGEGRDLPHWFVRDLIQDVLRAEVAAGRPILCDADSD